MEHPKISVIMGIYNCADTLPDSIRSIQNQTVSNWELIMCDDGSLDNTYQIAKEFQQNDDRIVIIKNEINMGLNQTLNNCLKIAKGDYIARMDGDDICNKERFSKELEILDNNSNIAIVSTDMEYFDENGVWGRIKHPTYPNFKDFIYGSPFCHAPCMVRKEAYESVNGYTVSKKLLRVEDYHLWMKMYSLGYKGMNIHECLYQMRDDKNAYKRRSFKNRINESYVKCLVIKEFKLPVYNYVHVLRPIIVGLLPSFLYDILHKYKLKLGK